MRRPLTPQLAEDSTQGPAQWSVASSSHPFSVRPEIGRTMHYPASNQTHPVAPKRSVACLFTLMLLALLPSTAFAQPEAGSHAGGEASLVLPPLDSVMMLGMPGST